MISINGITTTTVWHMVDTKEIMEKLERETLQQRKRKIKEWVKMRYRDLQNLIKLLRNSGIENIKLVDLEKVLKG